MGIPFDDVQRVQWSVDGGEVHECEFRIVNGVRYVPELTCELYGVQEDYPILTFEVRMSCGHDVYATNPDLIRYCPVCGARAIREVE